MGIFLQNKDKLILLINIFIIALSFILNPSLKVVYLFYLVFSLVIYKYFSSNIRRYLYFTILFYSIVTSGNSKYVFLFLIMYIINIIYTNLNQKKCTTKILNKNNKKYILFFIVFIIYLILSLFISVDKSLALKTLYRYIIMITLFSIMFIENNTKQKLKETLKFGLYIYIGILTLGCLEIAGVDYGLKNIFEDKGIMYDYVKRIPEVFFYNPNNYSVVLNIGTAALFVKYIYTDNKKEKLFYCLLILISEVQIIFGGSRIAWIVLFLTFIFVAFLGIICIKEDKHIRKKYIFKSGIAMLLSFMLFFSLSLIPMMRPYYGKFADSIVVRNVKEKIFKGTKFGEQSNLPPVKIEIGEKGSENERFTLMYNVISGVIKDKHYLGFGVGNIGRYVNQKHNTYGIVNIHSFWFEFLGDFGLPMFIYLIVMYCYMLLDILKAYILNKNSADKQYFIMFLTIGVIMVLSAFAPSTVLMFSPFWLVLGIGFSIATYNLNYK